MQMEQRKERKLFTNNKTAASNNNAYNALYFNLPILTIIQKQNTFVGSELKDQGIHIVVMINNK